jgi:hypothetical protein
MSDNTTQTPDADTAPDEGVSTTTDAPTPEDYAALEQATQAPDEGVEQTDTPDDDQGDDNSRAGRDAAKYRARLRETEAERDQLRDQLNAQRRAVIDWRATSGKSRVDPALLDAAGINIDELLDEESGHLNMEAVDTFIGDTVKRFNLAQGFTPNRGQGQSSAPPAAKPNLADAFRRQ